MLAELSTRGRQGRDRMGRSSPLLTSGVKLRPSQRGRPAQLSHQEWEYWKSYRSVPSRHAIVGTRSNQYSGLHISETPATLPFCTVWGVLQLGLGGEMVSKSPKFS